MSTVLFLMSLVARYVTEIMFNILQTMICHFFQHWQKMPNYAILVDTRDRHAPQRTYVPEENIEIISNTRVSSRRHSFHMTCQ